MGSTRIEFDPVVSIGSFCENYQRLLDGVEVQDPSRGHPRDDNAEYVLGPVCPHAPHHDFGLPESRIWNKWVENGILRLVLEGPALMVKASTCKSG